MPDEPVITAPVIEPPAPPQDQPPAAPEPTDERGVPLRNLIAEMRRKLDEQTQLNQQYQQVLGQRMQQPAPQPAAPDPLMGKFDAETTEFVRRMASEQARQIAMQVKQQTIAEMQVQEALRADSELLPEAQKQYAMLKSSPIWASADDSLVQDRAIAEAKFQLESRRRQAQQTAQTQQVQQQANRQQAAAASLPGAGGGPPPATSTDKETFIKQWMVHPENIKMFKMFERGVDPASAEGQAKFRTYAETAWTPTVFGGATGTAFRALTDANIEVVR